MTIAKAFRSGGALFRIVSDRTSRSKAYRNVFTAGLEKSPS
jgi:hypothetical protein